MKHKIYKTILKFKKRKKQFKMNNYTRNSRSMLTSPMIWQYVFVLTAINIPTRAYFVFTRNNDTVNLFTPRLQYDVFLILFRRFNTSRGRCDRRSSSAGPRSPRWMMPGMFHLLKIPSDLNLLEIVVVVYHVTIVISGHGRAMLYWWNCCIHTLLFYCMSKK